MSRRREKMAGAQAEAARLRGLSDDDLIAEAIFADMPRGLPSPGELAYRVLDGMVENFSDPAYRVEFAAAVIAVVPLARMRLPFLPSLLAAFAAGKAARWAYESVEDIRGKIGGDAPELVFHGAGCPGHTTGSPAECCMKVPYEAGDVRPG